MKIYCDHEDADNPAAITPWTFVHVCSAIGFCPLILFALSLKKVSSTKIKVYGFLLFSFFHLLYEMKDIIQAYVIKSDGYRGSWQNSLADQISAMIAAGIFIYYVKLPLSLKTVIILLFFYLIVYLAFELSKLG